MINRAGEIPALRSKEDNMGVEFYILNHANATYYDLGKGPWNWLDDFKNALRDPDQMVMYLRENWINFQDHLSEESARYYRLLGEDVKRFVGDAPDESLTAVGDAGDDHWTSCPWPVRAYGLKYLCTGSRYKLEDSAKNAEYIKGNNDRHTDVNDGSTPWWKLSDAEVEELGQAGWNTSKVSDQMPARVSRYALALGKGARP